MTIREAVMQGTAALRVRSSTPRLDSELLMAHTLEVPRQYVMAHGTDAVEDAAKEDFFYYIARRSGGTPIAYITGKREFYGLDFTVTPDVLIPKPDTETLVELAVQFVAKMATSRVSCGGVSRGGLSIADICTGSGCVGIAIVHECGGNIASAALTDISSAALHVARLNAARLLQADSEREECSASSGCAMEFLCGDLFDVFPDERKFDLIVANPPYIPSGDVTALLADGRGEPRLALDGDVEAVRAAGETAAGKYMTDRADGLSVTRRLVMQAAKHLAKGGALMVESSESGVAEAALMMRSAGLTDVAEHTDMAHLPRVAAGYYSGL